MEKLKKIFIYMIILSSLTVGVYAKGTLKVTTTIIPEGKTKKYNNGKTLLLDAGVMNSNSNINELKIATVVVDMQTEKTNNDGDNNAGGITGDFNLPFKLRDLENMRKELIATNELKKYKNGDNAKLEVYMKNIKILDKKINNENLNEEKYLFIAYPEEVSNISNKVERLKYSFDLYVEVSGVKTGDIVRKDVTTGVNSGAAEEAIGRIKDIIKLQFTNIQ